MGPRVPFMSNPFGAISPNEVVETVHRSILRVGQYFVARFLCYNRELKQLGRERK